MPFRIDPVMAAPLGAADGSAGGGGTALGAGGITGFGAETPAMLDPRPSFCRLRASSFPVASSPFDDWKFCIAPIVFASHLPFGAP